MARLGFPDMPNNPFKPRFKYSPQQRSVMVADYHAGLTLAGL
jgi:hypothetical protein